jgi:cytochrome c oxidase subunit 3
MAVQPSVVAPHVGAADAHGHAQRGISNPILGMLLFLASEVMFFAGLFAAYFNVRMTSPHWPPYVNEQPYEPFNLHTPEHLLVAGTLTAILVLSSFTFLIGQVWDYTQLEFGITDTAFGSTFYTLTGFHGAHVLGGAVMLSVVLYRGLAGQFSARHHDAVEATSLYWHFVDVVWIALFSTLYLL